MDSIGIVNNGSPVSLDSYLSTCRFRPCSLQPSAQIWEPLHRIYLEECDMMMRKLDQHSARVIPEEIKASMQASDAVVQALSGAMYSQVAKRYNQVLISMYRQDRRYLKRTGLGEIRDNVAEILGPRSPIAIHPRTSGMLEATGLKILQIINSLRIQSLGVPKFVNFKVQCGRFSINPGLQIMGSTGPIVVRNSGVGNTALQDPWGTSLGDPEGASLGYPWNKRVEDPWMPVSSDTYLDFPSIGSLALALSQMSLRNMPVGTPSSSILVMPEATIHGFRAASKHSTRQVILSNTIPGKAMPLIIECSMRLETPHLAKIWPGTYICLFARDMIFAPFFPTDIDNIEPGKYSHLIEGLLQLALPFPSFHIPLQMSLKPLSSLGTGAADIGSVTRTMKLTVMDMFDGISAKRLWVLQSDVRVSGDSSSQNWTLENLAVDCLSITITINTPVAGALGVLNVFLMEILETPGMHRRLRDLKFEQDRNNQSVKTRGNVAVIASQTKRNLERVPKFQYKQVHQQPSDLRRFTIRTWPALEAIKCLLRPWMMSILVGSASARPTYFMPEGLVQLSALDLVSSFGEAVYLGQQMAGAIEFQFSQDGSIYGLVLLSIALTGISSFALYDSTGNGLAYLLSVFIIVAIGFLLSKFRVRSHPRCNCGGRGCRSCGGGGSAGGSD